MFLHHYCLLCLSHPAPYPTSSEHTVTSWHWEFSKFPWWFSFRLEEVLAMGLRTDVGVTHQVRDSGFSPTISPSQELRNE